MIKKGLLDKHGKPTDNTPKDWAVSYEDYNVKKDSAAAPAEEAAADGVVPQKKVRSSSVIIVVAACQLSSIGHSVNRILIRRPV